MNSAAPCAGGSQKTLACDYNLARRLSVALSALRMFDPTRACAAGAPARPVTR
jgi:hypothetical protein